MKKKTGKRRSPRFPYINLQDAVAKMPEMAKLKDADKLDQLEMAKLMGYDSLSGPATRTNAAFLAYHLFEKSKHGPTLTEVGRLLATNTEDIEALQIAALSPLAFRRIWRNARNASVGELTELLMARNFTEQGAQKAAEIYRANAEFAKLDELEIEPPLPERQPRGRRHREESNEIESRLHRKLKSSMPAKIPSDALTLPVKSGTVVIPGKLTKHEFDLVIDTLNRWRDQLVE